MDVYQLDYVLHEPTEDHGWMYWAEIPALQGCNAWGDTPSETLEELWAVARAIIQSLKERELYGKLPNTPELLGAGGHKQSWQFCCICGVFVKGAN